jgi:hypothetical protein
MRPRKKRELRKMLATRTESEARAGWSAASRLKGLPVKPSHKLGKVRDDCLDDSTLLRS